MNRFTKSRLVGLPCISDTGQPLKYDRELFLIPLSNFGVQNGQLVVILCKEFGCEIFRLQVSTGIS